MYNQGALAYQKTAQQTANPRDLEANILARLAGQLQQIRDTWPDRADQLDDIMTRNRKVWSVFVQSCTNEANPLPPAVRQNIVNLGIFVMGQTYELMATKDPARLDALININRQISAGLRGNVG